MSIQMILAPLFVQVLLTLGIGVYLAVGRVGALRRGEVTGPIALREPNWPAHLRQRENSFLNQFELPVLFYLLTVLAIITRHADLFFVLMAWVFVVLRVIHAAVHLTGNDVRRRGPLFGAGALVLLIMWIVFILRIMLGLP